MSAAPLLLLLAGLAAQDPVRVQAGLSRSEVRVGETTVLRVDVETDGARAEIGRLTRLPPGIELASTRDYDQRQFSIPGGTRRFVTREFVLRGRAQGQFRIPAIGVTVSGRSYTTTSQILTVTPPPPGLRGPEAPSGPDGDVGLHAWLNADTVYVGEQVTMQAEAMFSQSARLRLRRAPEYEAPTPSGFWIEDLPERRTTSSRIVDNQVYEVQGFRRAFFPLSPGRHVIPPARLEYEMRRGILYAPETFEALSDSMPLVVLPVPERDRPPEFTGAVGRFTATGSLEPREVPAGEAVVLTVEVEGTGHVKALPPPRLPPLEGIDVFPPSEEAETEIAGGTVRGRKRFSWVLIPERAGELEIPPVRYAYFDPETEEFATAEVPGTTLRVTPGAEGRAAPTPPASLRYLKTAPGSGDPLDWVHTPWFALAQLLPLLAIAAGLAARRAPGGSSRRELRRRRRRALRDLRRRAAQDDAAFLPDAEAFARAWIAERVGIRPGEAGSRSALAAAGVPRTPAAAVPAVLERIAALRYAPTPPGREARVAVAEQLGEALERMDRETPAPGSRDAAPGASRRGAALLLALGLGLAMSPATARPASAGPASPQQAAARAFADGIALFDAEEYDEAAERFDAHVRDHPEDAAGWYNLGTSYYRAGHAGFAVWAWLHALELQPRDADTRHNLHVAGVGPELVRRASPPVPLRPAELALLASLAWLLAGIVGAWWLARGGQPRGVVAAVALVTAVGLGALWLASTRASPTLIVLEAATLRAGPTLGGEPLATLEPGAGVVPVAPYGEWVRVRTLEGREGWLENRSTGAL
ncbi:MAG: BatD family protein [Gemmatimonadetes bacterium]|nr:BatD family protein [Gemmatimonadota bacterium]